MATRDKLIFPSAITRILHHFSVLFPSSDHFFVMCAIESATVKRREMQFRSRQLDSAAPPSYLAPSQSVPSTSAPSSSPSDVTFRDIMIQLQRMDARLDTLSTELYQVNICVCRIARWQAVMGGFIDSPLHTLEAPDAECKVEFYQPSCWLYSVPNFLVFSN